MAVAEISRKDEQMGMPRRRLKLRAPTREFLLVALIVLQIVVFSILFPVSFPNFENFAAILRNLAADGILAVGMMIMLITGLFDLSVGGMLSMIGVITGWLMKQAGFPVWLAILVGLAVAALGGLINGLVVAKLRVNALIATLGTMGIFRGVAVLIGGPGIGFLPESFNRIGQSQLFGVQSPVWIMAALALVFQYLMSRTAFFRQYYYIGANEKAATLSGINVTRMQIVAFTIMGLIAGLAGIVFASRIGTSVSIAGDGAELRVITAVILGGASLNGGKGTIWGALIGVTFIALIQNILIIAKVDAYWQNIIIGVVLVGAVALDAAFNRRPRI
jgi:ribose/xylose/arabinose/galactoside ABC-type transport system permease subunit